MKKKTCKTCGSLTRPAPYPGPRCATCYRAERKRVKAKDTDRRKVNTYGLQPGDWERLLAASGGLCMICRKWRARACDHDHKCCKGPTSCGKCVRGALCGRCNGLLGKIGDSVTILFNMIEYLQNPPAPRILGGRGEEATLSEVREDQVP